MSYKSLFLGIYCLLFVSNVNSSAQKEELIGLYTNSLGTTLVLNSSKMVILSHDNKQCFSDRITDTIAVCTWALVEKGFIRIDSTSPYERVLESCYSQKSFDSGLSRDSIIIRLSLPVREMPVEVQLYDYNTAGKCFNKSFRYSKSNSNYVSCDSVFICIKPLWRPLNSAIFEGSNEPVLLPPEFSFPFLLIAKGEEQWNTIDINIPCLSDSFFEQAWILGEYIQVIKGGLMWHGDIFYRKEKQQQQGIKEFGLWRTSLQPRPPSLDHPGPYE